MSTRGSGLPVERARRGSSGTASAASSAKRSKLMRAPPPTELRCSRAFDHDQPVAVADHRMVPEGIAFDRGLVGARRERGCRSGSRPGVPKPRVAEQRAGIVAAADGVIAGREFLEAEQRLPRILGARAERERQLRAPAALRHNRCSASTVASDRPSSRLGGTLPAPSAVGAGRAAIVGRAEDVRGPGEARAARSTRHGGSASE